MGGTGAGHEPGHEDAELKPEAQLTALLHGRQLGAYTRTVKMNISRRKVLMSKKDC